MKTAKFIFALLLIAAIGQRALAQAIGHEEPGFPEKREQIKSVQIFPNPATDYLNLKLESSYAKKLKLEVFTIIGNTVDVESEILDDFEIRIKVRDLPSGYYLLAIQNKDTNSKNTLKFLKR